MPIYEYECQQGHRFELRQGFHDDPAKECVECQQPVRRLLSPAGIIFKGSGWYITDSRSSSSRSESNDGASTKSETPSETKSETKSEAKPAASESKSEAKAGAAA